MKMSRVNPLEFLFVTDTINPRLKGVLDNTTLSITYDMSHLEDKNKIHLCLTVPDGKSFRFYRFHIKAIQYKNSQYKSSCGMSTFIDMEYRLHPHEKEHLDVEFLSRLYDRIKLLFKRIAKERKTMMFCTGLIDPNSTLRSLSGNKIFDRHLAKEIYSYVGGVN